MKDEKKQVGKVRLKTSKKGELYTICMSNKFAKTDKKLVDFVLISSWSLVTRGGLLLLLLLFVVVCGVFVWIPCWKWSIFVSFPIPSSLFSFSEHLYPIEDAILKIESTVRSLNDEISFIFIQETFHLSSLYLFQSISSFISFFFFPCIFSHPLNSNRRNI